MPPTYLFTIRRVPGGPYAIHMWGAHTESYDLGSGLGAGTGHEYEMCKKTVPDPGTRKNAMASQSVNNLLPAPGTPVDRIPGSMVQ